MDSNLPAHYWRGKLEYAEFQRQKYVKKAAWSAGDAAEMDEINEKILYYKDMLDWCDIRDNDNWSWSMWLNHLDDKKRPKANPTLGSLPIDDEF